MRNPKPIALSEEARIALDRIPDILKARHNLDVLEYRAIVAARDAGATWPAISLRLGLSETSAKQRFKRLGWEAEEARKAMGLFGDNA